MPVPLTTAALTLSAILLGVGSEVGSIIVGAAGVLNQAIVTYADARLAGSDELG